ncbi:hypothetical protein C9F11_38700 [Streptomyces sp. YIM 121038]|uniref:hypothetical protein n=1 Tax=Streptomyces sp. YIM 121038 TaxID=2136401 RepID=UPI00110FFFD0|nr:hypothetical protein [Streptomyces sp. YIM 121038]QCX81323.1 hypothetical protein C9F11_38700 [Streptomyces sp. YIM 121038]
MHLPRRRTDLAVFLAVLGTGVVLVRCGIEAEAVSSVAIGLSTLYAAWQRQDGVPRPPAERDTAERDTADPRASARRE